MALQKLPAQAPPKPNGPDDSEEDVTLIHTRFSAAPQPRAPISEPRYIHALMIAAWLGRLIDPVDFAHHPAHRN